MSREAERDARGAAVNVLGLLAGAALPAFHVQLARFLGAAGYGLYTWSATFVDLFSVITLFGCDQAVMRQVSLSHDVRAVGTALRVVLVSGALVFLFVFFAAPYVAEAAHKPGLVGPLRCLALVPIAYHASTILLVATQALGVMKWAFWARSIAQPLVLLGTTSLALRAGYGPSGAAAAVAIGMGATAIVSLVLYARELPLGETLRAIVSGPLDRQTLRVALPLVLASLAWALVARVDAFFLARWGTESELGAYAACVLYAASITQMRGAFEPTTSALVAPALSKGDTAGLGAAIRRQTRWLALVAFPLAAVFIGFGDPLLAVFGHGFSQGTMALAVLAIGHVANALALSSFVLPLSGNGRFTTLVAVATLVVQSALGFALVPKLGLLGAALALSGGLVFAQATQIVLVARLTKVRGISPDVILVAACAAVGLGAGRALYFTFGAFGPGPLVLRFATSIAAAAIVYAIAAWVFALERDDRALATSALRRAHVFWRILW